MVDHKGCHDSVCDPPVNLSDPWLHKVAEQSHNYYITGSVWPAWPVTLNQYLCLKLVYLANLNSIMLLQQSDENY